MAIEQNVIINVDTEQSVKNVRQLNDTINEYITNLSKSSEGTSEWEKNLKGLNTALKNLEKIISSSIESISSYSDGVNSVGESIVKAGEYITTSSGSLESFSNVVQNATSSIYDVNESFSENTTRLKQNTDYIKTSTHAIDENTSLLKENVSALKSSTETTNSNSESFARSENTIKEYRKEIAALTDQLLNNTRGSEEYNLILDQIGLAQGKLTQTTRDARQAYVNYQTVLKDVVNVSKGLASGISTITSLTTLLGVESEDLNKVMVRLQASIALVQGIQGIQGVVNALPAMINGFQRLIATSNALRISLNSIPLIAVITGVTAAITILGTFAKSQSKAGGSSDDLRQKTHDLIIELEKENKALEKRIKINRILGASERETWEETVNFVGDSIEKIDALLDKNNKKTAEKLREFNGLSIFQQIFSGTDQEKIRNEFRDLNQLLLERRKELEEQQKELAEQQKIIEATEQAGINKIREQELSQIKEINRQISDANLSSYELELANLDRELKERLELFNKYGLDTTALEQTYALQKNRIIEQEAERWSDIVLSNQQQLNNRISSLRQEELNDIQNQANEELRINAVRQQELLNQIEQYRLDLIEAQLNGGSEEEIQELNDRIFQSQQQLEQFKINAELEQIAFLEQRAQYFEQILIDENLNAEERLNIENELQNTLYDISLRGLNLQQGIINKELSAKQKQYDEEENIVMKRLALLQTYASSLSSIASSAVQVLGQETAAGKAVAIAGATIDTLRAGVGVFAATKGTLAPRLLGLAAALAAGYATVKSITSTRVPGASDSSGSSVSMPTLPDVTVPDPIIEENQIGDINIVDNLLRGMEEQQLNNRVYVVESDITNSQKRVNVVQNEASF